MKTISINLYEFKELSDEAKKHVLAVNWNINVDYDWWQGIYEDAERVGLKITSFDVDRRKIKGKFLGAAKDTADKIIIEHGGETETFDIATAYLAGSDNIETDEEEDDDLDTDFLNDLLQEYFTMLTKEFEHLTSEEVIIETIESNGYTFEENGLMRNE